MTVLVKRAFDVEEKEKIFAFLYEIWNGEMGRDTPDMDHQTRIIRDELDLWARHFLAADETGRIVGCMRNNHFEQGDPPRDLDRMLALSELFGLFGKDKIAFTSRLAVEPASRGRTVTSQLFFTGYKDALASRIEAAVCYAGLHLVHLYYQVGYRPYAPSFRLPLGVRVPLVLCVRDREYLSRVGSPLYSILPDNFDDGGQTAAVLNKAFPRFEDPGFDKQSSKLLWAQLAQIDSANGDAEELGLFKGFEREDFSQLMSQLTRLCFDCNETLVQRDETESCLGVLLSGRLGIGMIHRDQPKFVTIIKPGEPFGELGGFGFGKRPLDIVALEKSEVVLLPLDLLDKFNARGSSVASRLTQNLLRIMAKRVHTGQQAVAALIEGGSHEVRVRKNSFVEMAIPYAEFDDPPAESYGFNTLKDQDSEYDRLVLQATAAEAVEISKLTQLGVKNGDVMVDLGSGPGIVSLMLAKYFPKSRIIGVEPNSELRQRAIATAARQNKHQCSFVEGIAENIPLAANTADFCYARMLFQHLPDVAAALREMCRITKPGGLIAVLDVDDASIITHPEIPGWADVQQLVADIQRNSGGNRNIGRTLLGLMTDAKISGVHVEAIPFTSGDFGGPLFYRLVFGFKRQILERAGQLTPKLDQVFKRSELLFGKPSTFGMVITILAHGRA